jgi:hypothetical protein
MTTRHQLKLVPSEELLQLVEQWLKWKVVDDVEDKAT